jgi:hypothetical protein
LAYQAENENRGYPMIYFGIFFALCIMAAVAYMALNKQSGFPIRIASLGALALMIITVIICLFIVLNDDTVPVDESVLIVGAPVEAPKDKGNNGLIVLLFAIFLVAFFAVIAFISLKGHKKH